MTELRPWTGFESLGDPLALAFYEAQTLAHRWSVRELRRQCDPMLFERFGLSRDREALLALTNEGRLLDTTTTNLRDPYVLEFLGLPERRVYSESDLEDALVDHLQEFLLELGGDFAFLGRQYRITVGGRRRGVAGAGAGVEIGPKDEVYLLATAISLVAALTLPPAAAAQKEWLASLPPTARLFLSNGVVIAITLGFLLNAVLRAVRRPEAP